MKKKDLKSYLKRSDITIEGNVASWSISSIGNINGKYIGKFLFKCYLTPTEKIAAGRTYRELLGANPSLVSIAEDNLAYSLSQLRYRIISSPPFWSSAVGPSGFEGDLPDENIITEVLEAAGDAELKFFAQLMKNKEETVKQAKQAAEQLLDYKEGKVEKEEETE